MDRVFPYPFWMSTKGDERERKQEASTASATAKVLGKNLQTLMASQADLCSNPKLAKRTGLGTGTISRLRNGDVDANLDTLERLATAFHVQPWQLLVPNIEPASLPVLQSVNEQERRLYERIRDAVKEIQGHGPTD